MSDFIFNIASSVLHMNLKDPHDVPFALPLMLFAGFGFIVGAVVLSLVGEQEEKEEFIPVNPPDSNP